MANEGLLCAVRSMAIVINPLGIYIYMYESWGIRKTGLVSKQMHNGIYIICLFGEDIIIDNPLDCISYIYIYGIIMYIFLNYLILYPQFSNT